MRARALRAHVFGAGALGALVAVAGLVGALPTASASDAPAASVEYGNAYHPIAPVRVLDTRTGAGPATTSVVTVGGRGTVPPGGVSAVAVNLTATGARANGYVVAYPYGAHRPGTSNVNFVSGHTVATAAIVAVDRSGRMMLAASRPVNLIVDVTGYFAPTASSAGPGLYVPVTPMRVVDTRRGEGATTLRAGRVTRIGLAGLGRIPASGAEAVVVNLTVVGPVSGGVLVAYPHGTARPDTSSVNFSAGQTVANRAVVTLGDGAIDLETSASSVDVLLDVDGWFTDGDNRVRGSGYFPIAAARVVDKVYVQGPPALLPGQDSVDQLSGQSLLPHVNSLQRVTATSLQLTAVRPHDLSHTGGGHLTAWADGDTKPDTSDLNYDAADVSSNLDLAESAADGRLDLAVTGGARDYLVDVSGYFALPMPATAPSGTWVSSLGVGTPAAPTLEPSVVAGATAFASADLSSYEPGMNVLRSDGTVWTVPIVTYPDYPVAAAGPSELPLSGIVAISALYDDVFALGGDGHVWGWGADDHGQLGDGGGSYRWTPVEMAGLSDVAQVFAGVDSALFVRRDGTVWAIGDNANGRLGDGTTVDRHVPVLVPGLDHVVALTANDRGSWAVEADASVWTWGFSGSLTDRPQQVLGACPAVGLAPGDDAVLVICADGSARWDAGQTLTGVDHASAAVATAVGWLIRHSDGSVCSYDVTTQFCSPVPGGQHTIAIGSFDDRLQASPPGETAFFAT